MNDPAWWQTAVIYQIYPRSFQDTTGNGVGDLPGVTERLDYLADTLGIDAIWLSPFYPSPMADFGYDISDYTSVHKLFGTIQDFDALLQGAHDRGLKVIIDWVPNHTSDEHPWFLESRSSRDNPKRDWYVWVDPKPDGSLPNNWLSTFGGSAWEFDEHTDQYYLHSFLVKQADLNWRNPEVQEAMFEAVRFWLDRGVDGLRIDVAHLIMKDPELRDNPPVPDGWHPTFKDHAAYDEQLHIYDKGHEDNHQLFRDVRALLDSYHPERFAVGEIHIADWEEWASYYGEDLDELHMVYNFSLVHVEWDVEQWARRVAQLEEALPDGAWPNFVLGNHDETRLVTRFGLEQAAAAAMLLLTLRGTPTIYYGDEIGLPEHHIPPEQQQDPHGRQVPGAGRDGCRTPMQWDTTPVAGFSPPDSPHPWLPLSADWPQRNVAVQVADPASLFNVYRTLLQYRRGSAVLQLGSYERLAAPAGCYLFARTAGAEEVFVAINFTDGDLEVDLPTTGSIAVSTYPDHPDTLQRIVTLRPHEGVIVEPT